MFKLGDYVIYGSNGICKVEDITHMDISGIDKTKLYYYLIPLNNKGSKIYTPLDNDKVIMRKILTREEAMDLIDSVPDIKLLWIENDKLCEQKYKQAVNSCDCRELFSIIKTMYLRKKERKIQGRKITATDERYLKVAEDILYSELSVSLKKDKREMEEFITERIEQIQKTDK